MGELNEEAKLDLDTALFLLREAVRYAEQGSVGGAAWRVADAAEWLRAAADKQGIEVQGLHFQTGRGNLLSQRAPRERVEV